MSALTNTTTGYNLTNETYEVFFLCSYCGNVPIIRFSASEPFTLGFICNYCNTKNFYTLELLFNKLSKEELNEYVQYTKPNINDIKEPTNALTIYININLNLLIH